MKTQKQIADMLELLKLQRLGIPARDFFGEDNHAKIDKQVEVLGLYVQGYDPEIDKSYNSAHRLGDIDIILAHDWARNESDEDLVEEDDAWVKKARASNKVAAK